MFFTNFVFCGFFGGPLFVVANVMCLSSASSSVFRLPSSVFRSVFRLPSGQCLQTDRPTVPTAIRQC
eukprot:11645-Prymnesium_polylepis.1